MMRKYPSGNVAAVTAQLELPRNISRAPRARWVVCPLGRTRGHGRRFIYPGVFEKKDSMYNGRFPAAASAWPLSESLAGTLE